MFCRMNIAVWLCYTAVLLIANVQAQQGGSSAHVLANVEARFFGSRFGDDRDRDRDRDFGLFGKGRLGRLGVDDDETTTAASVEQTVILPPETTTVTAEISVEVTAPPPEATSTTAESTTETTAEAAATTTSESTTQAAAETAVEQPASISTSTSTTEFSFQVQSSELAPVSTPSATVSTSARPAISALAEPEPAPAASTAVVAPVPVVTTRIVSITTSAPASSTAVDQEQETVPASQTTAVPNQELTPVPTKGLTIGEKAGLGVGVAGVFLIIAGLVVYELFRRRAKRSIGDTDSDTNSDKDFTPRRTFALPGLPAFLGKLRRNKAPKETGSDPEWSIESAEKIAIVRAVSVKSVQSQQTRPLTPPPIPTNRPDSQRSEVVQVGMHVPEYRPSFELGRLALRSNPPSPTIPTHAIPGMRTDSWPLPDQ